MNRRFAPFALLPLAACTVGPDYHGPPAVAAEAVTRGGFVRAADPALVAAPAIARWWETLSDPALTALVDDALAHSPDVETAEARIRQAQAALRQRRTAGLPTASANATYLRAQLPGVDFATTTDDPQSGSQGGASSSTGLDFYNLGANASWEPDLFGSGRRSLEQARADLGRGYANLADAQVSLSADVATAYVNLRDVQARRRLNDRSSALQQQALALTRRRFAAGTASALDVARLESQIRNTDAQNVPLAAQADEYRDQLAMLTGRVPGALDATLGDAGTVPLPPAAVPIADPAALIANRPDIRAAERALAARTAGIGVSKAKLFPRIQFIGILGLGGTRPGDVFDPGMLTTLLAPQLTWSLLDFGKNRAAVRQSEAERDEAGAQYRKTVLAALQDAETSLSRFGSYRRQVAGLMQAEAAASRAATLNDLRVRGGTASLIDQLDIERQRLSASIAVAQARARLTAGYIAIQKSLGLAWSPGSGAAIAAAGQPAGRQ